MARPTRIPLPMIDDEPPQPPAVALPASESVALDQLEPRIIDVLKTCYDPEIPVNIHELGLIYGIQIAPDGGVTIRMTLTSPACPVAGTLPGDVQRKVASLPGVKQAKVELVWDPPWNPGRMSEEARLQLGLDDYSF